jgi:hypothetical protein
MSPYSYVPVFLSPYSPLARQGWQEAAGEAFGLLGGKVYEDEIQRNAE